MEAGFLFEEGGVEADECLGERAVILAEALLAAAFGPHSGGEGGLHHVSYAAKVVVGHPFPVAQLHFGHDGARVGHVGEGLDFDLLIKFLEADAQFALLTLVYPFDSGMGNVDIELPRYSTFLILQEMEGI